MKKDEPFAEKPDIVISAFTALGAAVRKAKWALGATVVSLLIAGGLFLWNGGYLSSYIEIFPLFPLQPKEIYLHCNYAGKNLETSITLHTNINNYYSHLDAPKERSLQNGELEDFVYSNPKDNSIQELAKKIGSVARINKLTNDQALELATCFVQNIPYDSVYAAEVLTSTGNTVEKEQFPYETLFANKGICTSKTYLGSALLREMGYGTAIITLPQARHMALGIQVPDNYASFNSHYAYMEMTDTLPPGYIPDDIDPKTGKPITDINNLSELNAESDPGDIADISKNINAPLKITKVNYGASYTRIVTVKDLENRIIAMVSSLSGKKSGLQKGKSNISYWDREQQRTYADYLSTPATTQRCTYYYYLGEQCYTTSNFTKH